MKSFALLLLLIILSFRLNAQDNVFILVDVSRTVTQLELGNAKQLVKEVLSGNYSNSSFFSNTGAIPRYNFNNASHLTIIHFGDKTTLMANDPVVNSLSNNSELVSLIDKQFRTNPTDNRTYLTLAKAKCADEAFKNSMQEYTVVLVSDNVSDDFGGSTTGYSIEEQNLVNRLNTITTTFAGSLFISNGRPAFTVLFQKINLSGYGGRIDSDGDGVPDLIDKCPNTPKGQKVNQYGCPDTISPPLKIELTSFPGGTSKKPILVNNSKFTISWFCKNAPVNAEYKIKISPIENSGEKPLNYNSTGNTYSIPIISDGKWKITVSPGATDFKASSATSTIIVKTNSLSWFIWLLLIVGIGAFVYWYLIIKIPGDKLKKLNSISHDDNSSSGSLGSTINSNSGNSDYF